MKIVDHGDGSYHYAYTLAERAMRALRRVGCWLCAAAGHRLGPPTVEQGFTVRRCVRCLGWWIRSHL